MLYEIKKDLWFDNEKLYIVSGESNRKQYIKNYNYFDECSYESKKSKYPTIVFISTESCNLKCKYCYASEGTYNNVSKKVSFDLQDYIDVYDKVVGTYGKVNAISFFGGEPLLNYDEIKKFVEHISQDSNLEELPQMAIASNGTIMNSDIRKFLELYNIGFSTSLDGPRLYNDENRIGPSIDSVFDTVTHTLESLKDINVLKALQFTISKNHIKDYAKGDFLSWALMLESLGINYYEVVPVISEDEKYKIDLEDEEIKEKFILLCNDIADYCLDLFKTARTTVMPRIFAGIIICITKRQYQEDCSAGFSISAAPDKMIYPCHICADKKEFGINCDNNLKHNQDNNEYFKKIRNKSRNDFEKCNKCISKNICPYLCKGVAVQKDYTLPEDKCLMMEIFTRKTIEFLDDNYKNYKDNIKNMLLKIINEKRGN